MPNRPTFRLAFSLLAFAAALVAPSQAEVQIRITSAVTENSQVPMAHTVTPKVLAATDTGIASASLKLEQLTMHFSMTAAQQATLSQLVIDQQDATSARYHQWLTPQQFGAQFGMSALDLAKISAWLTAKGFTVTGTANSSTFITFSGTAGQVEQAFGTTIHTLSLNGEEHIGNLSEPMLPAAFAGVVANITGLNDFRLQPRIHKSQYVTPIARPEFTVTTTNGTVAHFLTPGDFYTLYNLNPLLQSSINGTGLKIAVMGQVDINLADVAAFRTASGISANVPTVQLYGADPGVAKTTTSTPSTNDLDEAQLDVEWTGATAPSASIIYVNSTDVIGTSLVQAIDNKLAPIMTVSYGNCEIAYSGSERNMLNALFQQGNSQGITIFGPSGDAGATDCDNGVGSATFGLAVDFPASSPFVTGIGGTMFSGDVASPDTYWNASNTQMPVESAKTYIPEAVWDETPAGITRTPPSFGAGGGGASVFFSKPAWQTGTGVPNDSSRDVPDVSLSSAAGHDGYFVCAQGSCTNGTYFNTVAATATAPASMQADVFGGTSVATPSFAGLLALVEQKIGNTTGLGNINPTLYSLANSTYVNSVFHDVTTGNNQSPCTAGTLNCPSGGSIGYTAGPGYDQATGWGSVDAFNLANDWKQVSAIGVGGGVAQTISTTTVAAPVTNILPGNAVALTVTVASGTSGTSGIPGGLVNILLDNALIDTAPALSSGTATYMLKTGNLSVGAHTIGAVYSGDTNFAGSKGYTPIAVSKYFTLSPSASPVAATTNVAAGGTAPGITFTINPASSFAGLVAFKASALSTLNAGFQFSATPLTIAAGTTSATTVLTLYAYVTNAQGGPVQLNLATNRSPAAYQLSTHYQSTRPWYIAGSGSVLAGLLLIIVPHRRRRWGTLLATLLCVGALGAIGCSSTSSTPSPAPTPAPIAPGTQTNTPAGSYAILVTATGTTATGSVETHTSTVNFVVR